MNFNKKIILSMFVSRQVTFLKKMFTRDPRKLAGLPDPKFIVGVDHFGNEYYEMEKNGRVWLKIILEYI